MPPERDLFANFERMRREIDELFGDVFERSGFVSRRGFSPRVDVYYCGDPPKAVVNVDLWEWTSTRLASRSAGASS